MPLAVQLRLLSCAAAANSGLTLLSADIGRRRRRDGRYLPMVNAVLLRPLPFPNSERLVLLRQAALQLGSLNDLPMSDALHFLYAEQSRTLDGVAGFSVVAVGFADPDNARRAPAASVTASFFDVLRRPPRFGWAFR